MAGNVLSIPQLSSIDFLLLKILPFINTFTLLVYFSDPNIRSAAEAALRTAEEQNLPQFMMALAQELAGEGKDANGRQLAGLHFKNLLSAKDSSMREAKTSKWKALDGQVRGPIKAVLIGALHSQEKQARHTAAQACAEVASIELPHGEWAEYLPTIMANVTENSQEAIKIATLECLGFTCELLAFEGNELNEGDTNQMLTAIVNGTTKEQTDEVRLAATVALRNSISFTKKNFEVPAERTMIMQTVCETTQCSNENVRAAAYEVLSSIVYSFYEKLQEYMQAIFEISFNSIKSDCQLVALQAIEFWCVLCETEMEVLDEIMSAKEAGYPSEQTCNRYVAAAMEHLVPLLTNHLSQQDEHAEIDDDIWNMSMASATLLVLVAQTVEDAVVPLVMPYVSQNIQSPEWRFREAAIMAFASILDGPNSSSIESYVRESVSVLLKSLQDPHQMVKSAAAYCIGKICDLHVRAVPQDAFPPLVQNLMAVLPKETPAVASQACVSLHNLAAQFLADDPDAPTNLLSQYMGPLLQTVLQTTEREGWDEANLRVSAYETVNILIQCSAQDCRAILGQMLPVIIQRLSATFSMQVLTNDDREAKEGLQGLLCGVIQVTTQKLGNEVTPHADSIMQNILQVLQSKSASSHEEAFLAAGALADVLGSSFEVSIFLAVAKMIFANLIFFSEIRSTFTSTDLGWVAES